MLTFVVALPSLPSMYAQSASNAGDVDASALWRVLDEATVIAERSLGSDPSVWWTKMGHTAQVPSQVLSLRSELTRNAGLRNGTICEVGFNAGHSAVIWLEATQNRLVEFDLMNLNYSSASRLFIESKYPGRVTFHPGPSRITMPEHAERVRQHAAPPCDLWLVDGDHGKHAEHDFLNAILAARAGTVIIADDANIEWPYVRRFWRMHVAIGTIEERSCTSTRVRGKAVDKTWCIGQVSAWATAAGALPRIQALISQSKLLRREARNAMYFAKVRTAQ
eukprot:CAMPEP_0115844472 /NCGR_PEP_ID=MMETSP0287-20121206/8845_1 /TAXON_ID=412157 /ORGANISM="Chrysochromulina rotalis, Strain UIO044" /LENGTH=277 /DNA_ID=CAMNT_0003298197 /DNA_START=93 /DNA_END=926 /DNA_ORIENTATION=+